MRIVIDTPIGKLSIGFEDGCVTSIREALDGEIISSRIPPELDNTVTELNEYFRGERKVFTSPLSYSGTPFQEAVWKSLLTIPYGQTRSYQEIATAAGKPKATRAAGTAIGKNPIAIIIPCHRVIRSDGKIGNFSLFGKETKKALLELEKSKA